MARFRVKPEEVQAVCYRPGLEDEWAHAWRDGVLVGRYPSKDAAACCPNKVAPGFCGDPVPVIVTPKGRVAVRSGDWVVTNDLGDRFVLPQDVFDATYQPK